jgi:hypothetical protein
MRHMKTSLDELDITYRLPLQPVQLEMRGGQAPWNPNAGKNGSSAGDKGLSSTQNNRFLSPDALGNGGRVNANTFQPSLTRNPGLDG